MWGWRHAQSAIPLILFDGRVNHSSAMLQHSYSTTYSRAAATKLLPQHGAAQLRVLNKSGNSKVTQAPHLVSYMAFRAGIISCLAYSPVSSGVLAAGSYSGIAAMYDTHMRSATCTLAGHTGGITQVINLDSRGRTGGPETNRKRKCQYEGWQLGGVWEMHSSIHAVIKYVWMMRASA